MKIPNLAGVIKKSDVHQKGGGSFKANYVAWAKTSQLLREHAPGWQFHLEMSAQGYVHLAPDGTGYLLCGFTNPEGHATSKFPFPIMDNRNMPIPGERISARAITDSHRRALCAAAAFHFGLAYELWADEEIEASGNPPPSAKPVARKAPTAALAREAINKADSIPRLDEFLKNLVQRHADKQLTKAEYESLCDAIEKRRKTLT